MQTNSDWTPRAPVKAAMLVAFTTVALAAPVCAQEAVLVYRLGKDTTAIEQFTRTANRMVGEIVTRTGAAVQRTQYDVALAADGRPTAVTYRLRTAAGTPMPNAAVETRITVAGDSIKRETQFADSTSVRMFSVTRPTPAQGIAFGLYEIAFQQMRRAKSDSMSFSILNTANANPGQTTFKASGPDTLRSLNGFAFKVDKDGKLLGVDGSATTQKYMATRTTGHVDIAALAGKMTPMGVLSARGLAHGSYLQSVVFVDYGRPQVRERTVWGGLLVPPDTIWRVGANEATHIATSREMTFGTVVVPPGLYTLFLFNAKSGGPQLVINRQVGQWGTVYDPTRDVGRVPMQMSATPEHVEDFTIALRSLGVTAGVARGALDLVWGSQMATASFTVK